MKKIIFTVSSLLFFFFVYSQNEKIEKEIRQIEEKRTNAFMRKDTAVLLKMYSADYFVNGPSGRVIPLKEFIQRLMSGVVSSSGYTHENEKIIIKGNIVISMGKESFVGTEKNPNAGEKVTMRYTNFWIKEKGDWKLFARHANIVCQQ